MSGYYVKFDLVRDALANFPDLAVAAKREGASRVAIVARLESPEALLAELTVSLHAGAEYVAVKAPTLEGTELWIVARDAQERFELSVGFDQISAPTLVFPAEKLSGLRTLHPFFESHAADILVVPGAGARDAGATGAGLAASAAPGEAVQKVSAATILADLEDTGRLIRERTLS